MLEHKQNLVKSNRLSKKFLSSEVVFE